MQRQRHLRWVGELRRQPGRLILEQLSERRQFVRQRRLLAQLRERRIEVVNDQLLVEHRGKDRLYANGPDATRLGFIDVATGEVSLEVPDIDGAIARQLCEARTPLV